MEHYLALRNETLVYVTTGMNLEKILNEPNNNIHMILLYETPREVKSVETESGLVIIKDCGSRKWEIISEQVQNL